MKRLLFVLLMMTCSVSWAEWEIAGDTDNFVYYVDRATIRKKGNYIEMWGMQNFFEVQDNSGKKYRSAKELRRHDCKKETRGLVSFAWYAKENGAGDVVHFAQFKNNEIEDNSLIPDSIGEYLWQIACGRE